jgi:hypothetical protein
MVKTVWFLLLFFACSAAAFAQNPADACVLDTAANGQAITVHGQAVDEPHDLAFKVVGCDDVVVLAYAGDQDTDVGADQLRTDENLERFKKYTSAVYKSSGKDICMECARYGDVQATLTGKLEVATIPPGTVKDSMGFLRDASGKVAGKWGWGLPVPFARYRLVIFSAADVKAKKLPKPTAGGQVANPPASH